METLIKDFVYHHVYFALLAGNLIWIWTSLAPFLLSIKFSFLFCFFNEVLQTTHNLSAIFLNFLLLASRFKDKAKIRGSDDTAL